MDGSRSEDFDMQVIGSFLSYASRGDRVGLNQMLMKGTSPDVQDYDNRTALHLAASEGHASIVELLLHYSANLNLQDRWRRTPLTDARLYGHRDICRILEVNGGKDTLDDHSLTFPNEVSIDVSELNLNQTSTTEQGIFGESVKVKWRGIWVVKTTIQRHINQPFKMILSAKDNNFLRELRHPNILQFLGSIVQGEEMNLITEYLSEGNLYNILRTKTRLDLITSVRYALDIARGMNYLHEHKPNPIVHKYLSPRNLLLDEGGQLKIGEYWVHMLYEQIHPNQEIRQTNDFSVNAYDPLLDMKKDIYSFSRIFYEMLEGRSLHDMDSEFAYFECIDFEPKFKISRAPARIQQLITDCCNKNPYKRRTFDAIIDVLNEVNDGMVKLICPVC